MEQHVFLQIYLLGMLLYVAPITFWSMFVYHRLNSGVPFTDAEIAEIEETHGYLGGPEYNRRIALKKIKYKWQALLLWPLSEVKPFGIDFFSFLEFGFTWDKYMPAYHDWLEELFYIVLQTIASIACWPLRAVLWLSSAPICFTALAYRKLRG